MSNRKSLIEDLTLIINNRENTYLTYKQVDHYIGSDMTVETLGCWVDETENNESPVGSDDVLSLWENGDTANETLVSILTDENTPTNPSLKEFLSAVILNPLTVSGIGVKASDIIEHKYSEEFDEIESDDEDSTADYNVIIKVSNFEVRMKMLFEYNGGWDLTRKEFLVIKDEQTIIKQGQFACSSSDEWHCFLEGVRTAIENTILNNGEQSLFDIVA